MSRAIYILESSAGIVKIGIARNVHNRMRLIKTATPYPIVLAYSGRAMTGVEAVEKRAHTMLATERMHGEWFRVSSARALEAVLEAAQECGVELDPEGPRVLGRRGRPTKDTSAVMVRMPRDILDVIDEFRHMETPPLSRSEVVRRVMAAWVRANKPAG